MQEGPAAPSVRQVGHAKGDAPRVSRRDSYALRRLNLMKKSPFCHWCGRRLVYFKTEGGQKLPDNFATIDHINSRLIHTGGRPWMGERVLSCPRCNQDRARQEELSLGIEELTRRSRHGHQTISPSKISSSPSESSIPAAQSGERREPMARARSENSSRARSI